MGKKKGKGKKGGPEEPTGPDVTVLIANYKKACKNIFGDAKKANDKVIQAMNAGAAGDDGAYSQINFGELPLGPAGVRAIIEGVYGKGTNMTQETYRNIVAIRFWQCNAACDGVIAIAELLRMAQEEMTVTMVELLDNNIGARGATALGHALAMGQDKHLVMLNLDYNKTLGAAGVEALCNGLRTNSTLKQLSISYSDIPGPAGRFLAQVLAFADSGLESLDLKGNKLEAMGLKYLCSGLKRNKMLKSLDLFDNSIGDWGQLKEADVEAYKALGECLAANITLTSLDLDQNQLTAEGVAAIKPGLDQNKTLSTFLVDASLDKALFRQLYRDSVKAAGGGKKSKGGKKKKKK